MAIPSRSLLTARWNFPAVCPGCDIGVCIHVIYKGVPYTPQLDVITTNSSIQVICWGVPPGAGVNNLSWTF
jgi:hypothetical protein